MKNLGCFVEYNVNKNRIIYYIDGDTMNNFEIIRILNLIYDKTRTAKIEVSLTYIKQWLDN